MQADQVLDFCMHAGFPLGSMGRAIRGLLVHHAGGGGLSTQCRAGRMYAQFHSFLMLGQTPCLSSLEEYPRYHATKPFSCWGAMDVVLHHLCSLALDV